MEIVKYKNLRLADFIYNDIPVALGSFFDSEIAKRWAIRNATSARIFGL
jgi:hypothetical protein